MGQMQVELLQRVSYATVLPQLVAGQPWLVSRTPLLYQTAWLDLAPGPSSALSSALDKCRSPSLHIPRSVKWLQQPQTWVGGLFLSFSHQVYKEPDT